MALTTVTRTYLELAPDVAFTRASVPEDCAWRELEGSAWRHSRSLYAEVGADYHWYDRLPWPDAQWEGLMASPDTRVFVLDLAGRRAGYVELARTDDSVEIAYFGLLGFAQGRGLGRWMLERAIAEAQAWGARRVWLHTCTLDSPVALPNYLARGFQVVRTEQYELEVPPA